MKLALASEIIESTRHFVRSTGRLRPPAPPARVEVEAAPSRAPHPRPRGPRYQGLHPLARRSLRGLSPLAPWDEAPPAVDLRAPVNPFASGPSAYPAADLYELRAALLSALWDDAARKEGDRRPCPLDASHALLTSGGIAALELFLRAFANPRLDRVAIATPAPRHFHHFTQLDELDVVNVPLRGQALDLLDVDALLAAEPKIILLSDPNDPAGSRLHPDQLLELVSRSDALVVVDEGQVELAEDPSAIVHLAEHPNLVILRTLSCAWGMAGARCGAILAHPLVIHTLRHAETPHPLSSTTVAEVGARLADASALSAAWARIRFERLRLSQALAEIPGITRVYPSEASSVLVQAAQPQRMLARLREQGIEVTDAHAQVPGALRIAIGAPAANDALLAALSGG